LQATPAALPWEAAKPDEAHSASVSDGQPKNSRRAAPETACSAVSPEPTGGNMNPFDAVVIVILVFCLIRGLFRGLIKEVSSIVGVLAGFYAAYTYYATLADFLTDWLAHRDYTNLLSFLLIFCGVFFIISLLGVVVKYLLNIAYLGWFDRMCGAGFGFSKGILITAVLLIVLTAFLPKGAPLIKNSRLSPYVASIAENMARVVSPQMKKQFQTKLEELKKAWRHPI
jgi:membrane protein required for colicin V production